MERVPVDGDDRPEREIKITGASVFVNPYKDMEEEERQKADSERRQVGLACCVLGYQALRLLTHLAMIGGGGRVACYP